jgi:hypothetical protein
MTVPQRVACAARGLFGDRHQAVGRWWVLMSPDGQERAFCSAACVLQWITYREWPAVAQNSIGTADSEERIGPLKWRELRAILDRRRAS